MGCTGDREKGTVPLEEKWDYVNLNDFKSDSCWAGFSYFFLWVFLIVSLAVYGVDTFTAINLLAFSRWSGRVEPAIPFKISRWIFAACILTSFALLIYRWFLAYRAIRSGSIARSYLDPLAVRVQSFRIFTSKGNGWKRFLVFAELTKSKKGAEYVALYTYFSFQFWMNTVFADGPRQVLNAITLYSVMKMDLLPGGEHAQKDDGSSPVLQFFNNVKILAEDNNLQAVVLFGMLFTLVIWVLSVLKLASAVILYLVFLFHHIPEEDGTLKAYCRRKISTRLKRIVQRKVNKALAKGFQLQDRAPTQPSLAGGDSKPTLPDLDKGPIVTTLSRSTTETTLPPYTRSISNTTEKKPTLPNLEFDSKPPLTRTTTQSSTMSESASLTGNAATMGYSPLDRQTSPLPPVPPLPATVPSRTGTPMSRPSPAPTPFANDPPGRGTPAAGYRNLTESGVRPYRTFTPANDPYARSNTPGAPVFDDYYERSYTPAADPYARSNTPGASVLHDSYGRSHAPDGYDPYGAQDNAHGAEDGYRAHAYSHGQGGYEERPAASNQSHPQPGYSPQDGYRSYTPASTGARPPPGGQPGRTMTPASYRSTPGPQAGSEMQPSSRTFTPMGPESPMGSQSGGYAAFNPSQTPQPRMQRQPPPNGYQPFTRANTASPSTMHRNGQPAGYSFNRANTDHF